MTVSEQSVTENKEEQVSSETTFDNSRFLKQVLEQAKSWLTGILEKRKA
ncbi:hypothetical protein HHO37_10310 [Streptococcus ursoris]|uniref:Uncharacterized protein n=1 Tax=Streptococcus ratti TaxID=1341 RepID=A0A7X9LEX9_STRRT|nr:hypothetical protein [Streptococcus ratti]